MKLRGSRLLAASTLITASAVGVAGIAPVAAQSTAPSAAAEGLPGRRRGTAGKTVGVIYLIESHPYYQAHKKWTEDVASAAASRSSRSTARPTPPS